MRLCRKFSTKFNKEITSYSTVKYFRKSKEKIKPKIETKSEYRENDLNIQMLSSSLYEHIFGKNDSTQGNTNVERYTNLL